jgi:hypothetical protein
VIWLYRIPFTKIQNPHHHLCSPIGVLRGVSNGVEEGRRLTAVSGVVRMQGVEGSGMAGLGETLGSQWNTPCHTPMVFSQTPFQSEKFEHDFDQN